MKKNKYIIFTLIISLLCINKSYAACTDAMKDEYKKLQHQYKITTTYDSSTKTYKMQINTDKENKFRYTFDIDYNYECKIINNTLKECTGLKPGTSFYAYILGNTKDCKEFITEEVIHLPKINEFYEDPLCEGNEDFVLCQEIYDREIDRETFEKRINAYKKNKEQSTEEIIEDNDSKNESSKHIKEDIIQIMVIVVSLILLLITIIITIKLKKSRRLE